MYKFVVPILISFAACWLLLPIWEQRIRFSGLVLQVLGLIIVVLGLSEARKRFGHRSLIDAARAFLARFPTLKPVAVRVTGVEAHLHAGSPSVSAFATVTLSPNTPLEERVRRLEESINQANRNNYDTNKRIDAERTERATAIDAERNEREKSDKAIWERLEQEIVGGLDLETIGVWWIGIGIVLATASGEIASMIT